MLHAQTVGEALGVDAVDGAAQQLAVVAGHGYYAYLHAASHPPGEYMFNIVKITASPAATAAA